MLEITTDFAATVKSIDGTLLVDKNFDMIKRDIGANDHQAALYYIDGFIKGGELQKLLMFLVGLDDFGDGQPGAADRFAAIHLPDVEVDVTSNGDDIVRSVLGGCCLMVSDGFAGEAVVIDLRSYPSRDTQDAENDRVMRGARDGFVETLIFNTALIRRRIRDTRLTMKYICVGKKSKTDVVVTYIDGEADPEFVARLTSQLENLDTDALPLGHQSLTEALCRRQWYNPFPKVRLTERPDATAAHLLEGGVAVLCDTSPEAMLLPTSVFDFLQETNDFYFPPFTGSYLRIIRMLVFASTVFITPLWYLLITHSAYLPGWLRFILPNELGSLPIIVQLFLTEFALDVLKLASLTTPSTMSNSLSIIGGLLLGDFAIETGWLIPEVIFYMAFTAISNFTQSNYELGYAFKYFRLMLLALTALFGLWGFIAGFIIIVLLLVTMRGVCGWSYLYPLIPWNGKALSRLFLRRKKRKRESGEQG